MCRITVSLIAVMVSSLLSGCAPQKRIIPVSPLQFEAAYRLPSYWTLETKFHRDSKYAEIDFYRWGGLSVIEYIGTWRIAIESVPPGLLREARTEFQDGPDLNEKQKAMLDAAMGTARQVGLFAPVMFPNPPSITSPKTNSNLP